MENIFLKLFRIKFLISPMLLQLLQSSELPVADVADPKAG